MERRYDPKDGLGYTQEEFVSFYGGLTEWDSAYVYEGIVEAGEIITEVEESSNKSMSESDVTSGEGDVNSPIEPSLLQPGDTVLAPKHFSSFAKVEKRAHTAIPDIGGSRKAKKDGTKDGTVTDDESTRIRIKFNEFVSKSDENSQGLSLQAFINLVKKVQDIKLYYCEWL
jgi:hypothetical protein